MMIHVFAIFNEPYQCLMRFKFLLKIYYHATWHSEINDFTLKLELELELELECKAF